MTMRIAVVHPDMTPMGGGELVLAVALETLAESRAVTLIAARPVPWEAIDERFGTDLAARGLPCRVPWTGRCRPIVMRHLLMRACRKWRRDFDLFVCTQNEMDFGVAGIQYMNTTSHGQDVVGRTSVGREIAEFPGPWMRRRISGFRVEGVLRNRTIVNSAYTGERVRRMYDVPVTVLHPPVPDVPEGAPWADREDRCAWVGRIDADKRPEEAIGIVEAVRGRGVPLGLSIFGGPGDEALWRRVRAMAAERPWCSLEGALPSAELWRRLGRFRYGLNTCEVEGFGIAVAEMAKMGCVVFVPDSGGQVEIVREPELRFRSSEEAVARMAAMCRDGAGAASMSGRLARDAARFSVDAFRRGLLEEAERAARHTPAAARIDSSNRDRT
ncbi:MAG: glycosyltransferase family 4 protein [Planctomycetes bacterium]|nr:glycosyltransferase family 4 protein [Planctomycetota bacterium]